MKTLTIFLSFALFAATGLAGELPRLTVLIVIDQFPSSHIERMPEGGAFRSLLERSAAFPTALHDHVPTETAPGHASISTGRSPGVHGIIGNDIYDRGRGKTFAAIEDPVQGIGPFRMDAPALADAVREKYPDSKIVSIAGKDRSSLFLGGRKPNATLWFDKNLREFVTTTVLGAPPAWLRAANDSFAPIEKGLAPPFSKKDIVASPAIDRATLAVALRALEAEGMGRDNIPDLLFVGFSATDYIGHRWGPDSPQMEAQLQEVDRLLGALVAAAEAVAPGRTLFALTSDHGILPVPESPAGRAMKARRIDARDLPRRLEKKLQAARPMPGQKWILNLDLPDVYLNKDLASGVGSWSKWVREVASMIENEPEVAAVYIPGQTKNSDEYAAYYRRSYCPGRSGDLQVRLQKGLLVSRWSSGTSHGSPYRYDMEVPVLLWGARIQPGLSRAEISVESLAPTIAAILDAPLAPADGRVLIEAIEP